MIISFADMIDFSFSVAGIILSLLGLIFVFKISYINTETRRFLQLLFIITLLYVTCDLLCHF